MNDGNGARSFSVRRRSTWRRWVLGGLAAVVASLAVNAAGDVAAFANVAEPVNTPVPSVSTVVNTGGTVTVHLSGTWNWTTLKNATSSDPCDSRFGVGWAMVWKDPNDKGFALSTKSATVSVNVGSKGVDLLNTDDKVTYDQQKPCGTFVETDSPSPGDGIATGTWTGTHTYSSTSSVPSSVCVVTFDITGNTSKGPDPSRLLFNNLDNSVADAIAASGSWNTVPGGPNCIALTVGKASPTLTTSATSAEVGSSVSDSATVSGTASSGSASKASGTIDFDVYAPADSVCADAPLYIAQVAVSGDGSYGPVSFTPSEGAGDYRWVATYSGDANDQAVSGTCGDSAETSVVSAVPTGPGGGSTPQPTTPVPETNTVSSPSTSPAPAIAATGSSTALAFTGPGSALFLIGATGAVLVGLGGTALVVPSRRRHRHLRRPSD